MRVGRGRRPPARAAAAPEGRAPSPSGLTTVQHQVDCACADMVVGLHHARRGDLGRAVKLIRRARHELAAAELKLLALLRARTLEAVADGREG